MSDPRKLLLPFAALAVATAIAALQQTIAAFFPGTLPTIMVQPDDLGAWNDRAAASGPAE